MLRGRAREALTHEVCLREPAPHALNGELLGLGTDVVLWQPTTGRHLRVTDPAALAAPSPPLRARLAALGFLGDRDPGTWYPTRSWWAVLLPDTLELWHALPLDRTPGGFPFRSHRLTAIEVEILAACTGARTVDQVAAAVGVSRDRALATFAPLTRPEVQAIQLREAPVRAREPALERLVAPPRPRHTREAHHHGPRGETTLDRYHAEQIVDGSTHFDDRETTLAHAFASPHPALAGRPFGAALATALGRIDGPVLEIGPGTGELCAAFRTVYPDLPYVRVDLSPELLATQEARCPGTRSLRASATALPLPDQSVGVVICNEVIADLEASPDPGDWPVTPEPGQTRFNTGAWAMLREVARVLKPGGTAWISEFGALDELPEETTQLDHPEVSIHFGQLAAVARSLGLNVSVEPVADALALDRTATWLSRPSWEAVRARARAEGRHLEARAWSPDTLPLPWRVDGLRWVPVTEPGAAPVVDRVLVAWIPSAAR